VEWGSLSVWCGVSSKGRRGEEEAWQRVANGSTVQYRCAVCCMLRTHGVSHHSHRQGSRRQEARIMEWHGVSQLLVLLLRFAATGICPCGQPVSQPAASTAGQR
jgi:hypothetical protein